MQIYYQQTFALTVFISIENGGGRWRVVTRTVAGVGHGQQTELLRTSYQKIIQI